MKAIIKTLFILCTSLSMMNCGDDNPDDPKKKPPVVTTSRCQKENFGWIYFQSNIDKNANFYNTKNVVTPLVSLIPISTASVEYDTGWFYYKLEYPGCSIHDYYGGFYISTCDTIKFTILGNGEPRIE